MDELSETDLHALQILAEKKAGNAVPFINIAAARRLTDFGLASRSHEGRDITLKAVRRSHGGRRRRPDGARLRSGPLLRS